jgi:hypothetical protein
MGLLCCQRAAASNSLRGGSPNAITDRIQKVIDADPFDSPSSRRPKGKANPTVAAGGDRDLLRAGIRLVRSFRELYREA